MLLGNGYVPADDVRKAASKQRWIKRWRHTTRIEPHVNRAARPERARSQSKTTPPVDARMTYARAPKAKLMMTDGRGRPDRSMYANILGAYPC